MANKIVQLNTRQTVDRQTGEVLEESSEVVARLPREPAFIKLYLEDINLLMDVPTGPGNLLHILVKKVDFEGYISLTAGSRDRICEQVGIKRQTLANYLQTLVRKKILKSCGRGDYELNPYLFAKGEWKDISRRRDKFIQLNIRYSPDGERTITSAVRTDEEALVGGRQIDIEDVI